MVLSQKEPAKGGLKQKSALHSIVDLYRDRRGGRFRGPAASMG